MYVPYNVRMYCTDVAPIHAYMQEIWYAHVKTTNAIAMP